MLRLIMVFVFCFSSNVFAQDEIRVASVKEYLRLSLWYEGMDKDISASKKTTNRAKKLPVEIEKILINF